MLSYRHSFHAGNFADVLKHIVLAEILEYLQQKEKPFEYFDTHAGAGLFDLHSDHATKLNESNGGIGKLVEHEWPELKSYFEVIRKQNSDSSKRFYPGSPLFAQHFLRPQDKSTLFELHPADFELLKANLGISSQTIVKKENGLKALLPLLPPKSRRGLILIDPSYEIKTDYETVVQVIKHAHRRFANGIYALWYPVVERTRIDDLEKSLMKTGIRNIQRFELGLTADSDALGMTACGMIVINPPWILMKRMNQLLPKLVHGLGHNEGSFLKSDVLVDE